jgi:site-specific recombinase XerD
MKVRIRLPAKLPRALTPSEIKALLRAAAYGVGLLRGESYSLLRADTSNFTALNKLFSIELMLNTGIRVGELVGIRLDNVDLEEGAITIMGKGHKERKVYILCEEILSLLKTYISERTARHPPNHYLLLNAWANQVSTDLVRSWVKSTAQ